MTENTYDFIGASGALFCARMVKKGQGYGRWDGEKWALSHPDDRPMVEFYDRRTKGRPHASPDGQFISRYYLETLKSSLQEGSSGLLLDTGSPKWQVTRSELWSALRALESVPRQRAQEICRNFEYRCIARSDGEAYAEIWRCKDPDSFDFAHDVTLTKMGITVVGDMDPLVFRVTGRDMSFLAGNDVDYYIHSKLDESSRDRVLDMTAVYSAVADAVAGHLQSIWGDRWVGPEEASPLNAEIGAAVNALRQGDSRLALDALRAILGKESGNSDSGSQGSIGRRSRLSASERLGELLDNLEEAVNIDEVSLVLATANSEFNGVFSDIEFDGMTRPSESVLTRLHVLNIGARRILEMQAQAEDLVSTEAPVRERG